MAAITSGPAVLDWQLYAGDRNRERFEIAGDDPVDISGAVIAAQARLTPDDATVAMTAVVTEENLALGSFWVEWPGEEVRALLGPDGTWAGVWDLEITEAGETLPRTWLRGKITALLDVTRVVPAP